MMDFHEDTFKLSLNYIKSVLKGVWAIVHTMDGEGIAMMIFFVCVWKIALVLGNYTYVSLLKG